MQVQILHAIEEYPVNKTHINSLEVSTDRVLWQSSIPGQLTLSNSVASLLAVWVRHC